MNDHEQTLLTRVLLLCEQGCEVRVRPGDFLNPRSGYEAHIECADPDDLNGFCKHSGYGDSPIRALVSALSRVPS